MQFHWQIQNSSKGFVYPSTKWGVTNAILADILKIDVNKEHLVHKETEKSTLPLNFTELKLLCFLFWNVHAIGIYQELDFQFWILLNLSS